MRYVTLGKTGLKVSEVGFGGIPIIRLAVDEAVAVLRRAFDKGITFYDTANAYIGSEDKIGRAFAGLRDQLVFATKTMKRDAAGAAEHIDTSLRLLRTDRIDLLQFHQVAQERDWQAISAPGGALEAAVKAKQQGKVRHLGVTSHSIPMAVKLVKTGLFATIQFPFSFLEPAAADELHVVARSLGLGIIAMKPFGGGVIDNAALSFKFLRRHEDVVPIPGFDSVAYVDEVVALYEKPNVVEDADLAAMAAFRDQIGGRFCRRCEYCQPCPNGVMITPAMAYPIIAHRMSKEVAVRFSKKPIESVQNCTECGVCLTRCPYQLPIPELIRQNYDLYLAHRRELGEQA
jgi:predicted aldo/keto reductase-like oxidoreductase